MPEPCYIPSKMLIHCADVMQTDQNATAFGIHAKLESIDRQFIVQPAFEKVYADAAMIKRGYRQSENVEVLKGHGRFTGPKILAAAGFDEELTAETILIAAGTLPWLPDIPGLDQSPYLTFDEALGLPEQPKRLSVIGGGYIAAQSPHFFGALGTEVNIIHRRGQMRREEDNDVARRFTKVYQRRFNMTLDAQVKGYPLKARRLRSKSPRPTASGRSHQTPCSWPPAESPIQTSLRWRTPARHSTNAATSIPTSISRPVFQASGPGRYCGALPVEKQREP